MFIVNRDYADGSDYYIVRGNWTEYLPEEFNKINSDIEELKEEKNLQLQEILDNYRTEDYSLINKDNVLTRYYGIRQSQDKDNKQFRNYGIMEYYKHKPER